MDRDSSGFVRWPRHVLLLALLTSAAAVRPVRERVLLTSAVGKANPQQDHVEFDPLLAELEQEQDDLMWMHRHSEDLYGGDDVITGEAGEYLEDALADADVDLYSEGMDYAGMEDLIYEAGFNITDRIIKLFPYIDTNPKDGRVSQEEMTAWHLHLGEQGSWHRTRREMELADADKDGLVTLEEALVGQGLGHTIESSSEDIRAKYSARFSAADADNNDLLNATEFHDFLHPEESLNERLHQELAAEEMRRRDMDGDNRLNLNEYEMSTHHEAEHLLGEREEPHEALQAHFEAKHHEDFEKAARDMADDVQRGMDRLDTNKDGYVDIKEFMVVSKKLWPSQRDVSTQQSMDVMGQADADGDGFLTLEEMLRNPHALYKTVEDEGGEDDPQHDEF